MAEFQVRHPLKTVPFLREMARYFAPLSPLETNHYRKVVRIVRDAGTPTVFATLNYDLLIEHSICGEQLLVQYEGLPASPRNLPLLKLHGSCNFLPIPQVQLNNVFMAYANSFVDAPIRRPVDGFEVLRFCQGQNSLAPAIAIYAEGKNVPFCPGVVKWQQWYWRNELRQARKVFVVGVRVHRLDAHVWEPLASSAGELFYVGRDPDPALFLSWAQDNHRHHAVHLADTFAAALPAIQRELSRL